MTVPDERQLLFYLSLSYILQQLVRVVFCFDLKQVRKREGRLYTARQTWYNFVIIIKKSSCIDEVLLVLIEKIVELEIVLSHGYKVLSLLIAVVMGEAIFGQVGNDRLLTLENVDRDRKCILD